MFNFEIRSMSISSARVCLLLHEVHEGGGEDCGSSREREGVKAYFLVHS